MPKKAKKEEKVEGVKKIDEKELAILVKKAAVDLKEKGGSSPFAYTSDMLGVEWEALGHYIYASHGVFQKDLEDKTHPYVAYTLSIIHALHLGYLLGTIDRKEGKKDVE